MKEMYRQGDVLLVRQNKPSNLKSKVPPKDGRVILAFGEVTGHHHSTDAALSQEWVDDAGVTWLEVKQAVELLHQEHAPVPLPKGYYRKVAQREYHPSELRSVID
jgi:hypothetical protein